MEGKKFKVFAIRILMYKILGGLHGTVDENIVNLKDEYMQQLQGKFLHQIIRVIGEGVGRKMMRSEIPTILTQQNLNI